jgi:hypothetical protein
MGVRPPVVGVPKYLSPDAASGWVLARLEVAVDHGRVDALAEGLVRRLDLGLADVERQDAGRRQRRSGDAQHLPAPALRPLCPGIQLPDSS